MTNPIDIPPPACGVCREPIEWSGRPTADRAHGGWTHATGRARDHRATPVHLVAGGDR